VPSRQRLLAGALLVILAVPAMLVPAGCGGGDGVVPDDRPTIGGVPAWFAAPPRDTTQARYAVGFVSYRAADRARARDAEAEAVDAARSELRERLQLLERKLPRWAGRIVAPRADQTGLMGSAFDEAVDRAVAAAEVIKRHYTPAAAEESPSTVYVLLALRTADLHRVTHEEFREALALLAPGYDLQREEVEEFYAGRTPW
jgi:hypothetical protein